MKKLEKLIKIDESYLIMIIHIIYPTEEFENIYINDLSVFVSKNEMLRDNR